MAVKWDDDDDLPPMAHLIEQRELLDMVQHWRMLYERLAEEKQRRIARWRRNRKASSPTSP